ncbi:MMPL family transporter, partial [Streptomyces rochei]|uniref:MMPL family transporter n=1 Tax=Streptomyces rochei TaxID=1928 RepID=UPI0036F6B1DE
AESRQTLVFRHLPSRPARASSPGSQPNRRRAYDQRRGVSFAPDEPRLINFLSRHALSNSTGFGFPPTTSSAVSRRTGGDLNALRHEPATQSCPALANDPGETMFDSFGRLLHRRRKPLLVLTLLFAVLSGAYGAGVFGSLTPLGFQDPGSDSRQAEKIAEKAFPQRTPDAVIVYRDEDRTVDDPSFQQAVVQQVESLPKAEVTGHLHFWQTKMPAQVSQDRQATYVALNLHGSSEKAKEDSYKAIKDKIPAPGVETLQGGTVPTGYQAGEKIEHDLRHAEIISAPVLFLFLLVVFGGLVAAGLPLVVGVLSILGSMAVLRVISNITDVSVFAMSLVTILGLAVAIDYGLLIVSRYREELERGYTGEAALGRTIATAGRTVVI